METPAKGTTNKAITVLAGRESNCLWDVASQLTDLVISLDRVGGGGSNSSSSSSSSCFCFCVGGSGGNWQ
jgi:hypothetical protein